LNDRAKPAPQLPFCGSADRMQVSFHVSGHMFRHRNTASVFTAELQAILLCLENIITQNSSSAPPNLSHNFTLSRLHLGHLKTRLTSPIGQPHTHSTHLSKHHFIQSHFHVSSRSLRHTRSEAVDKAAKQSIHLPRISPGLFPTHTDLSSNGINFGRPKIFTQ